MRRLALLLVALTLGACQSTGPTIAVPTGTSASMSSTAPGTTAPSCADPGVGGAFIFTVEQQSMQRTLQPGDRVLVVPDPSPLRGDVVVFNPPPAWLGGQPSMPFIKRVIGEPGDTVEIHDGNVFVNGTALDEPYVYRREPTTALQDATRWVVPSGDVFMLGDHRAASADSRVFGPIPLSAVLGVARQRCS